MNELHLCIATGQNAANFIPLKQLAAQEVWILETLAMKQLRSGANLSQALRPYVPTIQCIDFDDSSPQAIGAAAARLAENNLDGRDVVFHVTGGTKLMVLAIHQELALLSTGSGHYRTLYADTTHQTLDWMGQSPSQQAMQDVLTLNDLLLLRGYRVTNNTLAAKDQQRASARADISRAMGEKAAQLGKFFSTLAYMANQAESSGALEQQFQHYPPGGEAAKLLRLADEKGLLRWSDDGYDLIFADRDCARFFAGSWAEEYVFLKFTGMLPQGQYAMNVKVIQNQTKTENELDGIAVRNNRALFIECKSGKQHKAQDSIYKLAQVVKQVGGLMAQGLYVSAQALSEADRQRAKEYGIDVLAEGELPQFTAYLRKWAQN